MKRLFSGMNWGEEIDEANLAKLTDIIKDKQGVKLNHTLSPCPKIVKRTTMIYHMELISISRKYKIVNENKTKISSYKVT